MGRSMPNKSAMAVFIAPPVRAGTARAVAQCSSPTLDTTDAYLRLLNRPRRWRARFAHEGARHCSPSPLPWHAEEPN
jgi:hypothetical protein